MASTASPLGQPLIPNKETTSNTVDPSSHLKRQQSQTVAQPPTVPSSSPPCHFPPSRALPPPKSSRRGVTFDLNATRRYSSAPYTLSTTSTSTTTTTYTPPVTDRYQPANQTRHISLTLSNAAPEADAYMPTGRPRGESDLSRPSQVRGKSQNGYGFSIAKGIGGLVGSCGQDKLLRHALPTELLTAILLPLPYLLSSLLNAPEIRTNHAQHSTNLEAAEEILEEVASTALPVPTSSSSLIHACALTAGTLLVVGLIGRIIHDTAAADKRNKAQDIPTTSTPVGRTISVQNLRRLLLRMVGVGLPFLATSEIGGVRTGMILLCAVAAGLVSPDSRAGDQTNVKTWKRALTTRRWTCLVFVLSLLADVLWLRTDAEPANMVRGYVALAKSILFLQPPLPSSTPRSSKLTTSLARSQSLTSIAGAASGASGNHATKEHGLVSPLICTSEDINYTLIAGAVLGTATVAISAALNVAPSISYTALMISSASIASAAALYFLAQPLALRSRQLTGAAVGLAICTVFGSVFGVRASLSQPTLVGAAVLSYVALRTDLRFWSKDPQTQHTHDHAHDHDHITHSKKTHDHNHTHTEDSRITKYFLHITEGYPTLHSILLDAESRHIVYFMSINFTFMFIQAVWAYLSGSLGLLSDTIHMFFDCVGLIVGLVAAVMSKWPPSVRFPYGYGRVETLSGLGNGIFLMFVSVEFMYGSIERLFDGMKLQRVEELLVVSAMGLVVNLIGLKFVGHHHHGHEHDHGHSHGHGHGHSHAPQVNTSHSGKGHNRSASLTHHHEGHSSENMAGIYLHVLADTMGSAAVIVSSALTLWTGASYWDPIASFIIAGLIIAASLPLVMGSAKKLLLTIPSDIEFRLRDVLSEVSGLRGVAGYSVPRFWVEESGGDLEAHDHDHHAHDHTHDEACKSKQHNHHDHSQHDHAQNGHAHHSPHDHTHDQHSHNNHNDNTPPTPQNRSTSLTSNRSTSVASSPGTPPLPTPIIPITSHHSHDSSSPKISGVIHIIASVTADLEDVRRRVETFLNERNMDVLVHVDREGAGRCWCRGDARGRERQVSVVM